MAKTFESLQELLELVPGRGSYQKLTFIKREIEGEGWKNSRILKLLDFTYQHEVAKYRSERTELTSAVIEPLQHLYAALLPKIFLEDELRRRLGTSGKGFFPRNPSIGDALLREMTTYSIHHSSQPYAALSFLSRKRGREELPFDFHSIEFLRPDELKASLGDGNYEVLAALAERLGYLSSNPELEKQIITAQINKLRSLDPNKILDSLSFLLDTYSDQEDSILTFITQTAATTKTTNPDFAQSLLELAVSDGFVNVDVYFHLGTIALGKQNWEDARDAFTSGLELSAKHSSSHYNLALVYSQLGNLAQARSHAAEAVLLRPSMKEQDLTAARAHRTAERITQALPCYERAILFNSNDPAALKAIADELNVLGVHYKTSNAAHAERAFRLSAYANPQLVHPHYHLGTLAFVQRKYDAAAQHFRTAVAMQPTHKDSQYQLGITYVALNDTARARERFEEAKRLGHSGADLQLQKLR